ncbi:MAG TPA: hypothetical protein VLR92_08875, partial [Blastocatellia bacterium]|nr:hypothetical protein [Blastocatellia bacterium]
SRVAMCHVDDDVATVAHYRRSNLDQIYTMQSAIGHVCSWPLADITLAIADVRYRGQSRPSPVAGRCRLIDPGCVKTRRRSIAMEEVIRPRPF